MKGKANPPGRHHYVPKFLLSQWAGEDGRLERFTPTPKGLHQRRVFPTEAGFEEDLYTIDQFQDRWKATFLEHEFFASVDNAAAASFKKLREQGDLTTGEERSSWALFVSSLLLRTPTGIASATTLIRKLIDEDETGIASRYSDAKGSEDPETLEEWIDRTGAMGLAQIAIRTLPHQMMNEERNQHFVNMRWDVLDTSQSRHSMIVSDNPVIVRPVKLPGGHVAMPLGPDRLFLASDHKEVFAELRSTHPDEIVRRVNGNVAGAARVFVAARDGKQKRFIENRFGRLEATIFSPDRDLAHIRDELLSKARGRRM